MNKRKRSCMQRLTRHAMRLLCSVKRIPYYRMSDISQMDADLMRPSRFQAACYQRMPFQAF